MRRDSPAASKIAAIRIALKIEPAEGSSHLAAQPADLDAERELVANAGTPLANYFRHDRDGDLLRRLCANIESERRVNLVNQSRVDTVFGETRKHRARATARSNQPDKTSRLLQ